MRSLPVLLLLSINVSAQQRGLPSIIPEPVEMRLTEGTCSLVCPWTVESREPLPASLSGSLYAEIDALHPDDRIRCEVPVRISLNLIQPDTVLPDEWHQVSVTPDGITINAIAEEGIYRGSRTLIQLLEQGRASGTLPCLTITDWPRFPWRGMHLDACRHFWSVEFTKKYIDLLARYKMNSFHWHLTEDQGWRIEIKKYPKLTEVGAWRSGSQIGPYSRREYDSIPYGGFYTQDEIRDVVAYAKARHITVVPEIEMPGHAMAALAAYPQLGCTGGPYEVQRGWGVFDDVFCAGNDSVFTVLEDVLTEVMDLFPSEMIHIGGDECPKERWKTCAKCQARMKTNGLKDEHELQSYFIQRIEKFVNNKGRTIIGWDEILEGGLAPNAAVMSWRGTEGGIAAAKEKHNVVMSPGSHCYFDHYQGDPANEPLAIGGYTTVQKVYSYEPIPAELKPEEHKYILGAQGNVWTEYILTPEHVEYMAVPRMLALAEVLWTPKKKRDEKDFIRRLESDLPKLEAMKVNASKSLYQVSILPRRGKVAGTIEVQLSTSASGIIAHQEEGSPDWFGYTVPLVLDSDTRLRARSEKDGIVGPVSERQFMFNSATAQQITLSVQPNERYNDGGAFTLVDGITAGEKRVNTEWLGWREGVTITVDLGSEQDVRTIGIGALNEPHSWIHLPEQVEFSTSRDGKTFVQLGSHKVDPGVGRRAFKFDVAGRTRYVRLTAKHPGKIPEGLPGAGNAAWMFLDEVEVR
ncbi:MAG TPA: family 20 glycosylhydrolase [Flavobacteriales bacterium]|nr:family 20 glycosylhydrolase [Flavobacteriales bacterium]